MKRFLIASLAILMLFSLASCQKQDQYADVEPEILIQKGLSALGDGVKYTEVEDEEYYLSDYFTEPEWVDDSEIYVAVNQAQGSGYNINEVGIFEVEGNHSSDMRQKLRSYLEDSYKNNQSWYDSYMPEETPKLRDAEVKVFGKYVVYAILNKEDRAAFFDAVENELLK